MTGKTNDYHLKLKGIELDTVILTIHQRNSGPLCGKESGFHMCLNSTTGKHKAACFVLSAEHYTGLQ